MPSKRDSDPKPACVDLHGLRPEDALRRLAQALHAARVRGAGRLKVVTGRGWGNATQTPVLRGKVETWLRGPEGRRFGVQGFDRADKGGSLLVRLQ